MSNLNLIPVLEEIRFVDRYTNLCKEHNDFYNRMKGVHIDLYNDIFNEFDYDLQYFKKEHLYRIMEIDGDHTFYLNLVLKDGLVECFMNIKLLNSYYFPYGRFDFIPERMGVDYDRKRYNLPIYKNSIELKQILIGLFNIYEDIKFKLVMNED